MTRSKHLRDGVPTVTRPLLRNHHSLPLRAIRCSPRRSGAGPPISACSLLSEWTYSIIASWPAGNFGKRVVRLRDERIGMAHHPPYVPDHGGSVELVLDLPQREDSGPPSLTVPMFDHRPFRVVVSGPGSPHVGWRHRHDCCEPVAGSAEVDRRNAAPVRTIPMLGQRSLARIPDRPDIVGRRAA